MLLAAPSATLRGKMSEKSRYRPTAAIDPLLPAGSDELDAVPALHAGLTVAERINKEPSFVAPVTAARALFAHRPVRTRGGCRALYDLLEFLQDLGRAAGSLAHQQAHAGEDAQQR